MTYSKYWLTGMLREWNPAMQYGKKNTLQKNMLQIFGVSNSQNP